ncbi:MAG: NUDIX hydrolase [Promethearchaeota archaeon]|nr:MAG: NUDIX hydrolase [Candidatus Lokiarchaeota archaeon]
MEENKEIKFFYKKEFWYISVVLNTKYIDCLNKAQEIENLVKNKVEDLTDADLKKISWNKEWVQKVKDLGKNMSIKCEWIPLIESFPYTDENSGQKYDTLGYYRFEVEYYKDDQTKKASIDPALIQQIPIIIKNKLETFSKKLDNQYLNLDLESPIYIFVISDRMVPEEMAWNEANINKFKRIIGQWTEIYSGQWPDYSDGLFRERVQNNISNRLSELHYIRRNSGFIYMEPDNFEKFFENYMKEHVLKPTAQIRAVLFALMKFNYSLDILFVMKNFMDTDVIEKKIKNLTFLRGVVQTQMSLFYNELDLNRRQHYTKVLTHLIREFGLNRLLERINNKFEIIQESMDIVYQQLYEENQKRTQRGMNILNFLFGLGILIDIAAAIELTMMAWSENRISSAIFQGAISIGILIILLAIMIYVIQVRMSVGKKKARLTVDSVLLDEKMENIILIKRKYPPCAGQYAFPGGFIEPKESEIQALKREVKEETGLDIIVERKVGVYDKPGRDPRGNIISNAYLCIIDSELSEIKCSDESTQVKLFPLEKIKDIDLAFDHEDILDDALKLRK